MEKIIIIVFLFSLFNIFLVFTSLRTPYRHIHNKTQNSDPDYQKIGSLRFGAYIIKKTSIVILVYYDVLIGGRLNTNIINDLAVTPYTGGAP
jgi:hypothetical protein